jgi:predicted negative regulator of RcsB-dependent stress response
MFVEDVVEMGSIAGWEYHDKKHQAEMTEAAQSLSLMLTNALFSKLPLKLFLP